MRQLLVIVTCLFSLVSFAKDKSAKHREPSQAGDDQPDGSQTRLLIEGISCANKEKTLSYSFNVYGNFAPSSRVAVNVSGVKFSIKPDGTGQVLAEYDGMTAEEVFDNDAQAKKSYLKNSVLLKADNSQYFILSLRKKTLTPLDLADVKVGSDFLCSFKK
jgi:hypothetical protein